MDYMGRSPVPAPLLILAKVALFGSVLFPLAGFFGIDTKLTDNVALIAFAATIASGGLVVLIAAIVQLGRSIAVGLPERETTLRTTGLYRVSRNPIYLGAFMICFGSCLVAPHPVNIILFVIAVLIHVGIIRREEVFLEERFGDEWRRYKATVGRFIGRTDN